MRPPYRIKFGADGYGPHLKNVDRWQFGDNLKKERRCQQFILHLREPAFSVAGRYQLHRIANGSMT
ncbi:hypothetical protein ABE504_14985 [Paenibacillus oryzisoli]|uniref:hypothetical protein n=1 Tax=Paenibacillus oryzisoli TaxID=1850517 RepID=UPI003D28A9D5